MAPMVAIAVIILAVVNFARQRPALKQETGSLVDARNGFSTRLFAQQTDLNPVEVPPPGVFAIVQYTTAAGALPAYLTPDPRDGKKHPAIVWITGGDCNSIGDVWSPAPASNDQSAAAYRKAGILMMFPSLRGGNRNTGTKEGFLGEVDDVIAATEFLAHLPYVDSAHIYLGGHSTGGTLAMLVAECSDRYRAIFAFGPVADVSSYGPASGFLPFNFSDPQETKLRSPGYWLNCIRSPLWAFEGTAQGNIASLRAMAESNSNPKVSFIEVSGATHFSTLAATNALIAQQIAQDTGAANSIHFTTESASQNYRQFQGGSQ